MCFMDERVWWEGVNVVLLVGKMRASVPLWETVPGKEDGFELRQRKKEPG